MVESQCTKTAITHTHTHTVNACNNVEIGIFDGEKKKHLHTHTMEPLFKEMVGSSSLSKLCENLINIQHNARLKLDFSLENSENNPRTIESGLEEILLIVPFIYVRRKKKKRIGGVNGAIHLMRMSHCQDNNILHTTRTTVHRKSTSRTKTNHTDFYVM